MIKIEHVAVWVKDLEKMKDFYTHYFKAIANKKYNNPQKQFQSYFLSFEQGARLELMYNANIPKKNNTIEQQHLGWIHLAISVNSKEQVNQLTERLRQDDYQVISEPRTTMVIMKVLY